MSTDIHDTSHVFCCVQVLHFHTSEFRLLRSVNITLRSTDDSTLLVPGSDVHEIDKTLGKELKMASLNPFFLEEIGTCQKPMHQRSCVMILK